MALEIPSKYGMTGTCRAALNPSCEAIPHVAMGCDGCMSEAPEPLEPLEDLRIAVSVGAAAQTSIQHADTKAAVLLTGLISAAALAANQPGLAAAAVRAGAFATACMLALAGTITVGTTVAGWQLGRCLLPRLTGPHGAARNRFALPDLGEQGAPIDPAPVGRQREEAWAAAAVLAGIAMRKYQAIRTGLPWVAVTIAGSVGWLCLAATIGGQ
ncbi:hypothetical protein AB0K00_00705 [Dactylosporangium sp. NPDC049525]|uniref:hypothetical protein n=1 Tax=Dactylosporangium sp. NPDC049525 TaxID=3154730 RepID=UPI003423B8BD